MKTALLTLIAASALSLTSSAHAKELHGVQLPDQIEVAGSKLLLNGMGTRKATVFKVKVYVAGLYLDAKSGDPAAIIASPGTKQVQMIFVRDVGKKDIQEAWAKSLKANCEDVCESVEKNEAAWTAGMQEMKKGGGMTFTITPTTATYSVNGQTGAKIQDKSFAKAVLLAWLGKNPPNADLKDGMLGKDE